VESELREKTWKTWQQLKTMATVMQLVILMTCETAVVVVMEKTELGLGSAAGVRTLGKRAAKLKTRLTHSNLHLHQLLLLQTQLVSLIVGRRETK
jgi:hypothetical protein